MGARPLDRHGGGGSLWVQMLGDLRRRMADGEFAESFPGELALAREYDVSRHTAREAVGRLRREGAVSAARGRTPRVLPPEEFQQSLGTLYSLFAAVERTGQVQRSIVHTLDLRADGVVAARLGLEESTPLVYLERLRLADDEPLAVDRVWLPGALAAPLLDVDFARTALYDEYARLCGVHLTGGQEQIRALVPGRGERDLLGLVRSSEVAVLAIDRLGCAHGRPVEWRQTIVRGDRFSVTASFPQHDGFQLTSATREAHR
ncbi:GntR family transcriptional regulator [Pseudonocardia sp. WMMC193]|uniref:GntR family transcriptional regulator n=1 Tax=Pseudonocardia sp. WMMC193 TaxID=2911965 RepID=UPI001F345999|nr:GntR family transcriptional regulator [Pseudonocardia sp. WMMC193]MCF7552650.1 GntR family transcriptional regulator [Pseudonocardia sp. WMMC193]